MKTYPRPRIIHPLYSRDHPERQGLVTSLSVSTPGLEYIQLRDLGLSSAAYYSSESVQLSSKIVSVVAFNKKD